MFGSIINYGAGNIASVKSALENLNINNKITNEKSIIKKSDFLILPGVGSFPYAISSMRKKGLIDEILTHVQIKKKPILGICLGMQLFFSESNEIEPTKGLNFIKGNILGNKNTKKKNNSSTNIGWYQLKKLKKDPVFNEISDDDFFYFLHSYKVNLGLSNKNLIAIEKQSKIAAIVKKQNILGLQFHPEKSGKAGIKIFKNFFNMIKKDIL
tara:strand:- start:914 stop:1549 length:636 start_codon:yes stop_codon:yes gene_type:complete